MNIKGIILPPSGYSRDNIGVIIGFKASLTLHVTLDGVSLANGIFVEKEDEKGFGIAVYCSCWDALLGIGRT